MGTIIPYASRTGTVRNLKALKGRGWHLLISACGEWRSEGFPYAIDCGAYTAYLEWKAGKREINLLDLDLYCRCLDAVGAKADWILLPDIVGDGPGSLKLSKEWLPRVRARKGLEHIPLFLAVQDGMHEGELFQEVVQLLESGEIAGLFVGGETEWKESTLFFWGQVRRKYGCLLHVGRVNTTRRIYLCVAAGATSFDGTSATKYAVNLPKLDGARRQSDFFAGENDDQHLHSRVRGSVP